VILLVDKKTCLKSQHRRKHNEETFALHAKRQTETLG